MLKLFNYFIDICLLRRAPQDLPASTPLFVISITLSVIVGAIGVADIIKGISALAASMLDAVIALVMLRLVLVIQNHSARFLQTATALFGSSLVLGLIALPLQLVVGDAGNESAMAPLVSMAYLVLLIWVQVVIGHILRHALNISLPLGIGLALTYSIVSGIIIQALFLNSSV